MMEFERDAFKTDLLKEEIQKLDREIKTMYRVVKEIIRQSKGKKIPRNEPWWQINEN